MSAFAERLALVETAIQRACEQAGRERSGVQLIGVSKTHPAPAVLEALSAGLHHFGENRVEEAERKIAEVAAARPAQAPVWHMIGHVQSRKAREVAALFGAVHSVDTLKLAGKLAQAVPEGQRLHVFLECNVSGEAAKAGFVAHGWERDPVVLAELARVVTEVAALPQLDLRGLMTMAPIVDDAELARPVFRSLRLLRDALQQRTGCALLDLSMGMSDDYPAAIAEGATHIRVGRALFGERQQ